MATESVLSVDRPYDDPSRDRSSWWVSRPKWFRILCWTFLGLLLLLIVLAVRIVIGLTEAGEITSLRQRGAKIAYPWDSMEISLIRPPRFLIPNYIMIRQRYRWLVAGLVGCSAANVEGIHMEHGTDSDLRLIGNHFHYVKYLTFSKSEFSADALRTLNACHQIESLDLSYSDLDDQGVEILEHHSRLKDLRLGATLVSDASVKTLQKMEALKRVDLWQTDVSADAIASWRAVRDRPTPNIVHGSDELPNELGGTIRWSDGSRSANFDGLWNLIREGPLESAEMQTIDTSSPFLGRNDLSWLSMSDFSNGDYRWKLRLGEFESESVTIRMTNNKPSPNRFELRMPITKEQVLRHSRP